jgi:hypothetical protein
MLQDRSTKRVYWPRISQWAAPRGPIAFARHIRFLGFFINSGIAKSSSSVVMSDLRDFRETQIGSLESIQDGGYMRICGILRNFAELKAEQARTTSGTSGTYLDWRCSLYKRRNLSSNTMRPRLFLVSFPALASFRIWLVLV